jgi:hypothetical protein
MSCQTSCSGEEFGTWPRNSGASGSVMRNIATPLVLPSITYSSWTPSASGLGVDPAPDVADAAAEDADADGVRAAELVLRDEAQQVDAAAGERRVTGDAVDARLVGDPVDRDRVAVVGGGALLLVRVGTQLLLGEGARVVGVGGHGQAERHEGGGGEEASHGTPVRVVGGALEGARRS